MRMQNAKIAMVTKDKNHIMGSFGSAKYFKVITVENGNIVNEEIREVVKSEQSIPNVTSGSPKMFSLDVIDKGKQKHLKIAKNVEDCNYVLARGMCANAWDSIKSMNMNPIITNLKDFKVAVDQIIDETIVNFEENIGK